MSKFSNQRVRRLILVWGTATAAFVTGCGPRGGGDPHQIADLTVVKSLDQVPDPTSLPQPTLSILEPKADAAFLVRDRRGLEKGIRCVVRLEIPPGAKTPEMVTARLYLRKVHAGGAALTLKEKQETSSGTVLTLEGEIPLPYYKGSYELRAEGNQTWIVQDERIKTPGSQNAIKSNSVYSPRVAIRIKER